jgi:hypothetical protein
MVVFGFLLLLCHPAFFPSEAIPTPAALLLFHLLRRVSERIHILKTCESHAPLPSIDPLCVVFLTCPSLLQVSGSVSHNLSDSLPAANGVLDLAVVPHGSLLFLALDLTYQNDARCS